MSRVRLALCALVVAAGALAGVQLSSATFTDGSTSQTWIGAARDWTGPSVGVDALGAVVSESTVVGVTAGDAETAVASVRVEVAPAGSSSWTTLCTDTGAPWSCSWSTGTMADGHYQVRAVATDVDGNVTPSAVVTTEVVNTATVVLDALPAAVRGSITLTAQIAYRGVAATHIRLQRSPAGAESWQDLPGTGCAGAGTQRSCAFDTTTVADGSHDWRAVATVGGRTYVDHGRGTVIDNTAPDVTLTAPAGVLSGVVTLSADASDPRSGVTSVRFDHRLASGTWVTCGTDTAAPYTCSLNTAGLADGTHELRATATDGAGNVTTTATLTRTVDNVGPTLALSVPAGPISGPVSMTATATDDGAGMGSVQFQYRLSGAGTWTTCGTDSSAPYACTGALSDGTYDFRAIATNLNGRTTTSPVETRVVDTVVASVAITAPSSGTTIWGGTTVTASASSNKGVNDVQLQYRPSGGVWTTICTDNATPYSCAWDPSTLAYGSYELRAVMAHGSGLSLTSASVGVVVPQPGGHDVQGTTSLDGIPSNGDTLPLTYTHTMRLSSIAAALTPTQPVSTSVTFSGTDTSGARTVMTFGSGINLGTVTFEQQYIVSGRSIQHNATLTAQSTTLNGTTVTRIVVRVGGRLSGAGSSVLYTSATGAMRWTPSAAAEDTAGNATSTSVVVESGTADADL